MPDAWRTGIPFLFWRVCAVGIGVVLTGPVFFYGSMGVGAAALSSRFDIMSRQTVSVASNHELHFTTPTGVVSPGQTVTVTFPSGFNLGTIAVADLDLFHGATTGLETRETLAATAAAGTWGAAVSGQVITLTAPTDAGPTTISAGQKAVIRIGSNATSGTHQITNPSSAMTETISIGGTFGDEGGLTVAITSNDTIAISATIAAPNTGQNGGGGGGGNNSGPAVPPAATSTPSAATSTPPAPPVISNLRVTNITDVSAVVLWNTDVNADTLVAYGPTASYGLTATAPGATANHSVILGNLQPNTQYHFQVVSVAGNGAAASSTDQTLMTLSSGAAPANVFNFQATAGDGRVGLTWTNPPDANFSDVIIRARTDRFPADSADGRNVYAGNATATLDTGLSNGVNYFYANFARGSNGKTASGAFAQATPVAASPVPQPIQPPAPQPQPRQLAPQPVEPRPIILGPIQPPPSPAPFQTISVFIPTSTVPVAPSIVLQAHFQTVAGSIELEPDASGKIFIPAGQPILLRVPIVGLGASVETGVVMVGDSTYHLAPTPSGDALTAVFIVGFQAGPTISKLFVRFSDGRTAVQEYPLVVQLPGRVVEAGPRPDQFIPIEAAAVTVYDTSGLVRRLWDGSSTLQANPGLSAKDGTYYFIVPNGSYRVYAAKQGYADGAVDVTVANHLLAATIVMQRTLPTFKEILQAPISTGAKTAAVIAKVQESVNAMLQSIRTPQAEAVSEAVIAPTVATIGIATAATATSAFNLFNYLRFLLTQPFLLIRRRKRQKFGVVYDSLLKKPLDLVIVRLLDAQRKVVLQTRITNLNGQFSFFVRPGKYRVEVVKPGYAFPTQYLKDEKQDVDMPDLYHGEMIEVTAATTIAPNIPVDATAPAEEPKKFVLRKRLRQIQGAVGLASVALMCAALIIAPTPFNTFILLLQIGIYLLSRRFSVVSKPKGWGIVYDDTARAPLERAVVRIFHKKFNKLLETQVTDKDGKFGFFADKGVFYVTSERQGYVKYQSPDIDLTKKAMTVIDQSIPMKVAFV